MLLPDVARFDVVQAAESLPCLCQALAFPDQLFDAVFDEEPVSSKTPIRLYGGALLSECHATGPGARRCPWSRGRRGMEWQEGSKPALSRTAAAGEQNICH